MSNNDVLFHVNNYVQMIGEEYILSEIEELNECSGDLSAEDMAVEIEELFTTYAKDAMGDSVSDYAIEVFVKEMGIRMKYAASLLH